VLVGKGTNLKEELIIVDALYWKLEMFGQTLVVAKLLAVLLQQN
jgi:hypothetical protein